MPNSIVADYQSQLWIMEPQALKAFVERLAGLPETSQLVGVTVAPKHTELAVAAGVATIAIRGVLLDSVPGWMRLWGLDVTGYDQIGVQIAEASQRADVERIVLDVDSPGGMVAGVMQAADAIFSARRAKPVSAMIRNLGASAAYWLASQAQSIDAADANTLVGSIGVYTWYVDWSAAEGKVGVKIVVIRSGEHKGMGLDAITEKQIAAVQEYIDATAANFIAAVAEGRGAAKEKIAEMATGQLWIAGRARELGLIDAVTETRSQTSHISGDSTMDSKTQEEQAALAAEELELKAAKAELREDKIRLAERKNLSDLKAAFPDDLGFAVAAFEKGQNVAEAKADYCEVLRERLKEQAKKTPEKASAGGAPPISSGESETGVEGDFMQAARELAAEKKITMTAAMKTVKRRQPALHKAFIERSDREGRAVYESAVA
jgi:signal peptide peptidase SppA